MTEMTKAYDGSRIIVFEGLNDITSQWSYRLLGRRCPNKGDFYLSGAVAQAYKARQHLTTEYQIVEPVKQYTQQTVWLPKKLDGG